jgi:hypothetical protein
MPIFNLEIQFDDKGENAAVASFKRIEGAADNASRMSRFQELEITGNLYNILTDKFIPRH